MRRLRFLKILLPLVLISFLVILFYALRQPIEPHAGGSLDSIGFKARGIEVVEFQGRKKSFRLEADQGEQKEDGRISLENIRELTWFRDPEQPLKIEAGIGEVVGAQGERTFNLEEEVVIHDPEDGLEVIISKLEVSQAEGVARSTQAVRIGGANLSGSAAGLLYGLEGQPSEIYELQLTTADGATLAAQKALLLDHLHDVELIEDVRVARGQEKLAAKYMRVQRGREGELRQIWASGAVTGAMQLSSGSIVNLETSSLELQCNDQGDPLELELTGETLLEQDGLSLSASNVRAWRKGSFSTRWRMEADQNVILKGFFEQAPALLRADKLTALLDGRSELSLISAEAEGRFSFDGANTRAEAERAVVVPDSDTSITLFGSQRRKARLARLFSRVAAEEIRTDPAGGTLHAVRNVEATLLPDTQDRQRPQQLGLFKGDDAVHFVAEELHGQDAGGQLNFSGTVRGWQGERSLSAEKIEINREQRSLQATKNVTARIPRLAEGAGVSQADFIQIVADNLSYSESSGLAVFSGSVRAMLEEGWLEAENLELSLAGADQRIQQINALGEVRVEFREPAEEGTPRLLSGTADRLVYTPPSATVLLFGDDKPASIRRLAAGGATTTGRVLRYQLDLGTLEVDSGKTGPVRIITSDR